jgi:phospholipid/cholesterol/gamma-HCH transport system substrate-binding protein
MDERHLELKVGALLLAAVAGLLALLGLMGELTVLHGTALSVDLAHTGNVVKGAPVKLGGVTVGRVDRILLFPGRRDSRGQPLPVRLELSLEERVRSAMHADATVAVATQGPLGEPYLELGPGSERAPPLEPGAVVRGVEAPRLEVIAQRLSALLDSASRMLEEHPRALEELVGNVAGLSRTVDGVLTENRSQLQALASELAAAAKDLRVLSAVARKALEPGGRGSALLDDAAETAHALRREVPQLSTQAGKALGGLAALSGDLTPEDGARLKEALARYARAGEQLDRVATRAERILARIEAGEGTIGGLQKDPALYQDMKALLEDLKQHPWKVLWKQ